MATRASDYKRVTSKSKRSPLYVAPKPKKRSITRDDRLAIRTTSTAAVHQCARITCRRCGTTTTRVVLSGQRKIACRDCGHEQRPRASRPTKGMIGRFFANPLAGLLEGRFR